MSTLRDDRTQYRTSQAELDIKSAFADRFVNLMREKKLTQADISRLTGDAKSKISAYAKGDRLPQADTAIALADALDTTVDYLILGRQRTVTTEFAVPVLDVRLAAGAGSLNTDARVTTYMTLDPEIMRQIGRSTTKGLVIMEAEGASNEPLIRDGAPILIDELDTQIKEGHMYAFRLGDNLRIKRLRFNVTDIEAVSENPLFPPEIIPYDMRDQFQILGRAIWTFTRL